MYSPILSGFASPFKVSRVGVGNDSSVRTDERNDGNRKAAIKLFSAPTGCSLLINFLGQKDVLLQAFWLKLPMHRSEEFLSVKSTLVFLYPG